jgi:hypothetical protein
MADQPAKPHFSHSQLDAFDRCGEAWRRRYIEGEKIPPGIALMTGSAVHRTVEANMRQKIESHQDLPVGDLAGIAAAEFETACAGGYILDEQETAKGAASVLGEAKDRVVDLAKFHGAEQAPDYQPVLVEERVRIELPMCSHDLLGVLDLADDKDRVIDFKTAARKKRQSDADTSNQLTIYGAAFHGLVGRPAKELRLDVTVKTKVLARQVLTTVRTPADYRVLASRMNAALTAIRAGVFPPAQLGHWSCSARWCGYHSTCSYVNHERREAEGTNGE